MFEDEDSNLDLTASETNTDGKKGGASTAIGPKPGNTKKTNKKKDDKKSKKDTSDSDEPFIKVPDPLKSDLITNNTNKLQLELKKQSDDFFNKINTDPSKSSDVLAIKKDFVNSMQSILNRQNNLLLDINDYNGATFKIKSTMLRVYEYYKEAMNGELAKLREALRKNGLSGQQIDTELAKMRNELLQMQAKMEQDTIKEMKAYYDQLNKAKEFNQFMCELSGKGPSISSGGPMQQKDLEEKQEGRYHNVDINWNKDDDGNDILKMSFRAYDLSSWKDAVVAARKSGMDYLTISFPSHTFRENNIVKQNAFKTAILASGLHENLIKTPAFGNQSGLDTSKMASIQENIKKYEDGLKKYKEASKAIDNAKLEKRAPTQDELDALSFARNELEELRASGIMNNEFQDTYKICQHSAENRAIRLRMGDGFQFNDVEQKQIGQANQYADEFRKGFQTMQEIEDIFNPKNVAGKRKLFSPGDSSGLDKDKDQAKLSMVTDLDTQPKLTMKS